MKNLIPSFIFLCILSFTWSAQAQQSVVNLGFPVNSAGDDFAPSISGDGKTMVFNSRFSEDHPHDIFITRFVNGRWTKPEPLDELNSDYNDETPFISHDGTTILFASDRPGQVRPSVTSTGVTRVTFNIYVSHKRGEAWTEPVPVTGQVNTIYNERSPALSKDKNTLYFIRWPYRYPRGARVMKSVYRHGNFENIEELPVPINTDNYEMSFIPSYALDGFYLSSRRQGGYGGWDIYFVPVRRGVFGKPLNLGKGINTESNDLFAAESMGNIYFSSDRFGGLGKYDIYRTPLPRGLAQYIPVPNEQPTENQVTRQLQQQQEEDKEAVPAAKITRKPAKEPTIIVKKKPVPGTDFSRQTDGPTVKPPFPIETIYFDFNSYFIREQYRPFLNKAAQFMKENPHVKVRIAGHTDLIGEYQTNIDVSRQRAEAAAKILINQGIDPSRIIVIAAGEKFPLIRAKSDYANRINRRALLRFIR